MPTGLDMGMVMVMSLYRGHARSALTGLDVGMVMVVVEVILRLRFWQGFELGLGVEESVKVRMIWYTLIGLYRAISRPS